MKMMGLMIAAIVVAGASGCASSGSSSLASNSGQEQTRIVLDSAKVEYVERVAKQRGVDVIWVNPPQKRVVDKGTP